MRAYEQIAIKTFDVAQRVQDNAWTRAFDEHGQADLMKWKRDDVSAVHIYLHPDYMPVPIGSSFRVRLAFNYDLIPGKELELIQLLEGQTVQLMLGEPGEGLSHLGYHIPDSMWLLTELDWWNVQGFACTQISVTTEHTGTNRRYLYAFVDTRQQIGAYTKIISRMTGSRDLSSLVEEYSHVNTTRR